MCTPAVRQPQDPRADYRRYLHAARAGIDSRYSYRGADVVATLEQAAHQIGYPKTIRLDNGPEFISKELDLYAFTHDVTLDFSRPGKPTIFQCHVVQGWGKLNCQPGTTHPWMRQAAQVKINIVTTYSELRKKRGYYFRCC